MTAESPAFHEYLAVDESPVAVESGRLAEGGSGTPTAICVTDRRILLVSEAGGFVDVPRSQLRSIRSRPTTTHTDRELGALGFAVGGGALAALAAAALLLGTGGTAVLALATLVVLGTGAVAALWRFDVSLDGANAVDAIDRIDASLDRVDALEDVALHRRYEERAAAIVDGHPLLRWAAGLLAAIGTAGLVAQGAWTALVLTLAGLCGVGAAGYGAWHVRTLAERGERVRHEREVSLHLVDGRTVRFRVDADATIDRELGRLTAGDPAGSVPAESAAAEPATEPEASPGP